MDLLAKIKKRKKRIKIDLVIITFFLFILIFMTGKHLNNIRKRSALETLNANSEYKITLNQVKNCQNETYRLFTNEKETYYAHCIDKVYILYENTKLDLKEVIKNKKLSKQDILSRMKKMIQTDTMQKYQEKNSTWRIYTINPNNTEVMISKN